MLSSALFYRHGTQLGTLACFPVVQRTTLFLQGAVSSAKSRLEKVIASLRVPKFYKVTYSIGQKSANVLIYTACWELGCRG